MWQYEDAVGIIREGRYVGSYNGQGSDVAYIFQREDGKQDVVSGKRLKEAKKIQGE